MSFPHCSFGILLLVCGLAPGCGDTSYTPAGPSDPAAARRALTEALDSWKSGDSTEALAGRTPRVFVGDEDWREGITLRDYKVVGEGERYGNNVRFEVVLELAAKASQPIQKSVRYLVVTDPVLHVTRDDRAE